MFTIHPIGDFIELLSGIALKGDDITDDKNGIPILRGINITEGFIRHSVDIDKYYVGDTTKLEKYFVKENDLVLGMDGSKVGKNVALVNKENENSILIQRVARIRATNKSNINYIYHHIFSKKFHDYVNIVNTSSGIPHISSQQIKDFKIGFSTLSEQTKIASFLTAIDTKINQLTQKKSLLEQYKKGIMQKLFSQEIRFKDDNGNDFADWEVKKLSELCSKIQSGGTPKSTNKKYYNGNIPFLSISDMTTQGKYISYTSNHISELGLKNSSSWLVPKMSLIYSMYASVGFVAINKIPIATSQAVLNLVLKDSINLNYLYYFLIDFQKQLAKFITTGTQGNLNAQTVKEFDVKIPSIEEQAKIANFLSAIDEKINQVNTQLEKTTQYKKGLLQQMFV